MLRVLLPLTSDWFELQVHLHRTISSSEYFCHVCGFLFVCFLIAGNRSMCAKGIMRKSELLMAVLSPLKSISFSSHTAGNSTHEQPYLVLPLTALRTFPNNLKDVLAVLINMVSYTCKNHHSEIPNLDLAVRA